MTKAKGNVRSTDTNLKGAAIRVSSGRGQTMTPAAGLGKKMVDNLSEVVRNANRVYEADRKAAAIARRAEVAARKQAALDALLAEIQG